MKQPVDTVTHILMLYKLATVSLLNAFLHSSDEAGLIFEHACNSVFHQLLGVLAIGRGHLLEPRFNLGGEMYFHAFQDTGKPARGQWPSHRSPVVPSFTRSGNLVGMDVA
ncbi:MAG: hypothetical protein ABSB86_09235 [Bryobacteraceae bacterium]